jgi:hypothetical protein
VRAEAVKDAPRAAERAAPPGVPGPARGEDRVPAGAVPWRRPGAALGARAAAASAHR